MNTVIVIPAVDPNEKLMMLIHDLRRQGFSRFIVVDDGSTNTSGTLFEELELEGVPVLHHAVNLGKGVALKTGISAIQRLFPEATHVVTVDADGQHLPEDVQRVAQTAKGIHDHVVIGVRDFTERGVPLRSRLGNAFSSFYFKCDTGLSCPDTQTGLRAIPISLVPFALSIPGTRYEYEMNFLTAVAKQSIPLVMMPISTVYENHNASSHFSTLRDSVRIYGQFFRFAGSSLVCAVVDLLIFALVTAAFNLGTAALVTLATIVARLASGALNFNLNRNFSFSEAGSAKGDARMQGSRYAALFLSQMCASAVFVTLLSTLPLPLVTVKMIVDGALFVASYFIQRNWVFARGVHTYAFIVKGGKRGKGKSKSPYSSAA